jgi:photoactive yellow protein
MTIRENIAPTFTTFGAVSIDDLEGITPLECDELPFGLVGLSPAGLVEIYNAAESRLAGLRPERVIGRAFFAEVAPCMNNDIVARRFETEPKLDVTIDYVLSLRMRRTPVKLRMLRSPAATRRYLLVQR